MFYFWVIFSVIMVIIGLVGVLVPFLPGIPLAFLGTLFLAYLTDFNLISPGTLWFLGVLALLSVAIDYFAGILGARLGKASIWGVVGALVGVVAGMLILGPLGIIVGPVLGVLIFELIAKKDTRHATRAAKSTFITSLLGIAINAIIAIIFALTMVLALIY